MSLTPPAKLPARAPNIGVLTAFSIATSARRFDFGMSRASASTRKSLSLCGQAGRRPETRARLSRSSRCRPRAAWRRVKWRPAAESNRAFLGARRSKGRGRADPRSPCRRPAERRLAVVSPDIGQARRLASRPAARSSRRNRARARPSAPRRRRRTCLPESRRGRRRGTTQPRTGRRKRAPRLPSRGSWI